jgi:hypothetical protein
MADHKTPTTFFCLHEPEINLRYMAIRKDRHVSRPGRAMIKL